MIRIQQYESQHCMPSQTTLPAKPRLQCFEYHTPMLNQWHHLVSAIKEKALTHQWVTLINPPFIPNDQYLNDIGLGHHYIRIIRLSEQSPSIQKYIQRCLQNGKSALVAIWSTQSNLLPDILQDDDADYCQTLLFTDNSNQTSMQKQLEFAF